MIEEELMNVDLYSSDVIVVDDDGVLVKTNGVSDVDTAEDDSEDVYCTSIASKIQEKMKIPRE